MRKPTFIAIVVLAGVNGAGRGNASAQPGSAKSGACVDCSVEFAARSVNLGRAGWRVASLEIREPSKRGKRVPAGPVELEVLFRRAGQGRLLTLSFSPDGLVVQGFREDAGAAQTEDRVCVVEGEILSALTRMRPRTLTRACGGYELGFGSGASVCLDRGSFHVVERSVQGRDAPRALALELLRALDEKLDIAAVVWFPAPVRRQHRAIKLLWAGEVNRVIVVGLSRTGHVRAVEVRRASSASARSSRNVEERSRLRSWLELAHQVVEVDWEAEFPAGEEGGARAATLHGATGRPYRLDLALLVPAHDGCGCPDP